MTFIKPMLTKSATEDSLTDTERWENYAADLKVDGMRAILVRDSEGARIYGRSGIEYTDHLPHLVDQACRKFVPGTTLDGEIAYVSGQAKVYDRYGLDKLVPLVDFNKTMRVMGSKAERAVALQAEDKPLDFIVFDVLNMAGVGMLNNPFSFRRMLVDVINAKNIGPSPIWYDDFPYVYKQLMAIGAEGLIMKNRLGLYVPGKKPSKNQYKIKSVKTFDVVVIGFTDAVVSKEDKKGWKGLIGAIIFGAYDDDGNLADVGRCSGMTDEERRYWTDRRDSGYWEDEVIEVKANDLVGSGKYRTPRHPQYVARRLDKKPSECTMDQFKE